MKRILLAAAAAVALSFLAASGAQAAGERFVFVSHAPDSDSWWNTVKNGLKNAEHDLGVKVEYRNPPNADINVLEAPIKDAIAKGIPVITVNSGTPAESKKLGALMHIGQPEYDAGKGAGERAK